MAHNSPPMHFACLPLSTILFMWQVRRNTQEPMGKLKGRFVRSRHCFARMKTHIQPSLLTDLHLCRMVFHPASCSWGAACELKFLLCPVSSNLMCKIPTGRVQLREDEYRSKQQIYHDKRHQARALPSLTTGEQVWVRDQNREGQILGATKQPRSYLVRTEMSTLRRNRSAIVSTSLQAASPSNGPTMAPQDQALPVSHTPPNMTRRSGVYL